MNKKISKIIKNKVLHGKNLYTLKIISAVALFFNALLASAASASAASESPPIPHGIMGTVFLSDGTQASRGTNFNVSDINSGFSIDGTTGGPPLPIYDGFYSVSINGTDGDEIIIKAWNTNIAVYGTKKVNLSGDMSGINVTMNIRFFPGLNMFPTDPDGDGLYEDINGNGRKDFSDVVIFFNNLEWIPGNEPIASFDFNGNGRMDFADIIKLFEEV